MSDNLLSFAEQVGRDMAEVQIPLDDIRAARDEAVGAAESTGLDREQTSLDRLQTGQDSAAVQDARAYIESQIDTLDTVFTESVPPYLQADSPGGLNATYVSKGELVVNVKNYGSAGDGVTDDTVAIQAAVDECALNGGGTVLFPNGTYLLESGEIKAKDGVHLSGDEAILIQPKKGKFACIALDPGVSNVTISGLELRGPWYGIDTSTCVGGGNLAIWQAEYADNVAIDIRGRWYQREVLGLTRPQMLALRDEHYDITVRDCHIEGFGQSGIIADQVTNFRATNVNIYRNGRDGVRLYGVVKSKVSSCTIGDFFPAYADGLAPNFNMYGVAATRLYGKPGWEDPDRVIGRPSQDVIISNNHVFSLPTWKGLDTHGGWRISFINNLIEDCFIGIGLDKGGYDAIDGITPPRDVVISGNTFRSSSKAKYMRAAITAYGHDGSNAQIFNGLTITGNIFDSWGGNNRDAAIAVSNVRNLAINGNVFRDTPRAAVTLEQSAADFTITGNSFDSPRPYITASVTNGGGGYETTPTVEVTGGGGSGLVAVARINKSAGTVTSIDIIRPGKGWTSAPTLTLVGGGGAGATATAQFTRGHGVLVQTPNARGVIGANTFRNADSTDMTAISLQTPNTGYGVKVSQDNTFYGGNMRRVQNALVEAGGTATMTPTAWANVNVSDTAATLSSSKGVASIAKIATGRVSITLENESTTPSLVTAMVTPKILGTTAVHVSASATSGNEVEVRTFTPEGAGIDIGFYILVNQIY